jgi:hypothetical protein
MMCAEQIVAVTNTYPNHKIAALIININSIEGKVKDNDVNV